MAIKRFFSLIFAMLVLAAPTPARAQATTMSAIMEDEHAAVILVYHRIGEDQSPSSSIQIDQFAEHVAELTNGGYNVQPLPAIIAAFRAGEALPPKTIAITFDGGHRSVLEEAVPLLLEKKIPFTIFVAPGTVDQSLPHAMDWDDLRKLANNKLVTIGVHSQTYARLAGKGEAEIARQVNNAKARFREEMKKDPALFAYPFGEYGAAYRAVIERSGFTAAFGQQSGVAYSTQDMMTLPRFSMTEAFGGMERFRMTTGALPFPVTDIAPADPYIADEKIPPVGFTVPDTLRKDLPQISCFASGMEKVDVEVIGDKRVELRLPEGEMADRMRINCTLPAPKTVGEDENHWRWFGLMLSSAHTGDEDPEWEDGSANPNQSYSSE